MDAPGKQLALGSVKNSVLTKRIQYKTPNTLNTIKKAELELI